MVEPSSVITAVRSLVDLVVDHQGRDRRNRAAYYEDFVEPLYRNAGTVYENYIELFQRLIETLEADDRDIDDAIKLLEQNRFRHQALRAELRAFANELERSKASDESGFAPALRALTMGGISLMEDEDQSYVDFSAYGPIHPARHTILYWIKGLSGGEVPKSQARQFYAKRAREQQDCLAAAWNDIAKAHAALKTELKLPG